MTWVKNWSRPLRPVRPSGFSPQNDFLIGRKSFATTQNTSDALRGERAAVTRRLRRQQVTLAPVKLT